ncbi:hypothetical protein [Gryllotalpicola koreensis]|uniref:Uncharacterized protein n=1 Tax=Gryllotalpicola koreensis TaxID=993086 RepID=A0ABP8A1U3_9MICO
MSAPGPVQIMHELPEDLFWIRMWQDAFRAQCEVSRRWMRKADEARAEVARLIELQEAS